MSCIVIWVSVFTLVLCTNMSGNTLYEKAINILDRIPTSFMTGRPIYNEINIRKKLYITQYDENKKDYQKPLDWKNGSIGVVSEEVIPLLKQAAELNHTKALVKLADIYLMGEYFMETNYSIAIDYYHRAVSLSPDGHAYFMLGFIYSTGLFGEATIDQGKASMYYEYGAANNDINSLLALGYRTERGIGTPSSCERAILYYNRLAQIGKDWLLRKSEEGYPEDEPYNLYSICISDFKGGLFGDKLKDTGDTTKSKIIHLFIARTYVDEHFFDSEDNTVRSFFTAVTYYDGDQFLDKNYTKAFETFHECAASTDYPDAGMPTSIQHVYLCGCQAYLGRMYLYGQGVEKNYELAYSYLNKSLAIMGATQSLNDLGYMYHYGLINGTADFEHAAELYKKAIMFEQVPITTPALNLAKLYAEKNSTSSNIKKAIDYTKMASSYGLREAMYNFAEYSQLGLIEASGKKNYTCEDTLVSLRIPTLTTDMLFAPHLKFAFIQLRNGNFKNALLGYLMAAEQGFIEAQMSAAYILFQRQSLLPSHQKLFSSERIKAALKYYTWASESNREASALIGEVYLNGVKGSNLIPDYRKAFQYFSKATRMGSAYGAYNLAYMYEHGLGTVDSRQDLYMSKRYYDTCLKLRDKEKLTFNKFPVNFAILRLRLKLFFNENPKNKDEQEGLSFLDTLKHSRLNQGDHTRANRPNERAEAHHYGIQDHEDDNFEIGDYLVLILSCIFFIFVFIQSIILRLRRLRDGQNRGGDEGWRFRMGGQNFEFQFFAL